VAIFFSKQRNCLNIIQTSVSVSGQWLALSWAAHVSYSYTSLIEHADESIGFMKDGELTDSMGVSIFLSTFLYIATHTYNCYWQFLNTLTPTMESLACLCNVGY